jgi:phosphoribosylanthranilate isomerase
MTRVKVCGVTNAADRDAIVTAGADALGVIVDVPVETPREVAPETAAGIVDGTPPFVTTVLVTMSSAVEDVLVLQETVGADAIQVHGGLAPEFVGGLGRRTAADVIAVVGVDDPEVADFAAHADAILLDASSEDGGGGTGETVDWDRAATVVDDLEVPVVLAGGLRPENVAAAVETVSPFAVDVATGVERTGGRKDHEAVAAFVSSVRGAGGAA